MTEAELKQLYFLNKECEQLQKDINDRKNNLGYKSPRLSDLPKGTISRDYTDEIAEIADLEYIQSGNLSRIQKERARLEEFIGHISDGETRLLMRLRYINCMTWEQIGSEMNMDRRTASRKYARYMKDAHNAQ